MKLEFLSDISEGGKYKQVISENLIRLYDFNEQETRELTRMIDQIVIKNNQPLDLSTIDFIKPVNCRLILRSAPVDDGIIKTNEVDVFGCNLTVPAYRQLIDRMKNVTGGYHWLCETSDDAIDFLYSPGGAW